MSNVRTQGFAKHTTVEDAVAWVDDQTTSLPPENVDLRNAAGRVLAADITSEVNVPGFARAMMDGYAVIAEDTAGATCQSPRLLKILGESLPGTGFKGQVVTGHAVRIMTGAPIPAGADAVLPVELTAAASSQDEINAVEAVAAGKNFGRVGEDIAAGSVVLKAGRCLRPQDVGVLSSIGVTSLSVVRRPKVHILVTGNELLPAGSRPEGNKIVDANSPMLAALVARDGGMAEVNMVPDNPSAILAALNGDADVVLISGGSSVGQEDFAPSLLAEHGDLAIHGIAMRPGGPAGMGRLGKRLVFLLPGNPVACLCAYDFFACRAIRQFGGLKKGWPYLPNRQRLAHEIASPIGRTDYCRVVIGENGVEPLAISGGSMLSSTTQADGFVVVPHDSEGYAPGVEVDVWLYDFS